MTLELPHSVLSFFLYRTSIVAPFHFCGTSPGIQTAAMMLWMRYRVPEGSPTNLSLESPALTPFGPVALSLAIALGVSSVSAGLNGFPSNNVVGRCAMFSMMDRSIGTDIAEQGGEASSPSLAYWTFVLQQAPVLVLDTLLDL